MTKQSYVAISNDESGSFSISLRFGNSSPFYLSVEEAEYIRDELAKLLDLGSSNPPEPTT